MNRAVSAHVRGIALTRNVDADRLAEGRDNDDETDVGNPNEVVDPLSEIPGRGDDAPELGRPKEVDGRVTEKVGKDVDWPAKSLSETLDPPKVGADVEGTVITDNTEESEGSIDGKVVDVLSEPYDRVSVGSKVDKRAVV